MRSSRRGQQRHETHTTIAAPAHFATAATIVTKPTRPPPRSPLLPGAKGRSKPMTASLRAPFCHRGQRVSETHPAAAAVTTFCRAIGPPKPIPLAPGSTTDRKEQSHGIH